MSNSDNELRCQKCFHVLSSTITLGILPIGRSVFICCSVSYPLGIVTRSEPSSAGTGQEKRLSLWEGPSMKSQSNIYADCTFFLDLEKHELQMRRADFSLETFRKLSNKSNRLLWNPGKLLSLRFLWFYRRVPALYFFIKATKRLSFFFKV